MATFFKSVKQKSSTTQDGPRSAPKTAISIAAEEDRKKNDLGPGPKIKKPAKKASAGVTKATLDTLEDSFDPSDILEAMGRDEDEDGDDLTDEEREEALAFTKAPPQKKTPPLASAGSLGYNKKVASNATDELDRPPVPRSSTSLTIVDHTRNPDHQPAPARLPVLRRLSKEDPAPVDGEHLSEEARRSLVTVFGQRSDVIMDMLEVDDNDRASTVILRTLIQMMVDVLPAVEQGVRESRGKKGVYQLNQTVSQLRELCNDMAAARDRTGTGLRMVDDYIRPTFRDIGVQASQAFFRVEGALRARLSKEDADSLISEILTPTMFDLADYMTRKYDELRVEMIRGLG